MSDKIPIHRFGSPVFVLVAVALLVDCSSNSNDSGSVDAGGSSASDTTAGATAFGGAGLTGGAASIGGISSMLGGASSQAGSKAVGGSTAAGGTQTAAGGITGVGGRSTAGGASTVDGGTKEDAGYLEDGGELATFTMIYNDIISVRCVSCHVPGGAGVSSGKLDMSTKALAYSNLVGASGMGIAAAGSQCGTSGLLRVTPNEHATSLLWQKVDAKLKGTAAPCGNPMPPGSPASTLSQAQVDDIADWIDSGALDD